MVTECSRRYPRRLPAVMCAGVLIVRTLTGESTAPLIAAGLLLASFGLYVTSRWRRDVAGPVDDVA